MSSVEDPEPSQTGEIPRWCSGLVTSLELVGFGMAINQVSEVLSPWAVGAVVLVWAFLFGLNRLPETSRLAKALPGMLLVVLVGGLALAVAAPASWTGPIVLISAAMIMCAMLATQRQDRAVALISLVGISVFTSGLVVISEVLHHAQGPTSGRVLAIALGCSVSASGLHFLAFPQRLVRAFSPAFRRETKIWWAQVSAMGIIAVAASTQAARDGHLLVTVLSGLAGLSGLGGVGHLLQRARGGPRRWTAGPLWPSSGWTGPGGVP